MWAQGNKFSSLLAVNILSLYVWDDDQDWPRELEMGLKRRPWLCAQGVWGAVEALLSISGHWVRLYSPNLGSEWDHWMREEDSVWKEPALVLEWIVPFSPFSRGVGSDALVCRAWGEITVALGSCVETWGWAEGSQPSTPHLICQRRILSVCCQEHIWVNSDEEITLWKSFFWKFPCSAYETRSRCRNCPPALGSREAPELQVLLVRCLICLMAQERNPKPVLCLGCKFSAE